MRQKIVKILHIVSEKIFLAYRGTIFFLRNKVWPLAKIILLLSSLFIIFLTIYWLTEKGLTAGLSDKYQNLFSVLTGTIGTMVAIFFSLILIPLNQIATKYSVRFLKYLKRDRFFIFVFLFSVLVLIYNVIFLFIGASKMIAAAAIILFVFLIILLVLSIRHIVKLSDPYNSILLPAHKEIVKTFRKLIPRFRKSCEKMTKQAFKGRDDLRESVNICLFQIDEKITDYIEENLLPIREVAIKAIKDLDFGQAKNAIQTMMSIIVHYLYARKEYHSDNDPLLYFLYTEYKLIAQAGNNELKIRLHPFIVDCWKQVGLHAAVVNVKGMKRIGENFNGLVMYPILGLKELCALNMLEMDSYAPGKACDAMAEIGVQLMKEGYDNQAAEIVKELETISLVAEQHGIKNVSGSADYAIIRIYAAGVSFRNSGSKDPYNHPYREINRVIDKLLEKFLQTKRSVYDSMILSPFIGWLTEPFKGLNLSRISEYGIFNPELNEISLERNLECVKANIKSLKSTLGWLAPHEDWYFSKQVLENLYRIILNLLSYLDEPIAKDHILFYKKHPVINKKLISTSTETILEALSVFCELAKSRADRYIFENDHLHILFSIYLILLYEYKMRPNPKLKNLFEGAHKLLVDLLSAYKTLTDSDSNDDFYKYYRLLIVVLNENNFADLSSNFDVPEFEYRSRGIFASHKSQYPETMFDGQWIIQRPGFQVNGYYYNNVESALKLDQLKFY